MYIKPELIEQFLIENEMFTDREINIATSVGGYNEETLNYLIYYDTAYHDIEQLYECEPDSFYFNDEILELLKTTEVK